MKQATADWKVQAGMFGDDICKMKVQCMFGDESRMFGGDIWKVKVQKSKEKENV